MRFPTIDWFCLSYVMTVIIWNASFRSSILLSPIFLRKLESSYGCTGFSQCSVSNMLYNVMKGSNQLTETSLMTTPTPQKASPTFSAPLKLTISTSHAGASHLSLDLLGVVVEGGRALLNSVRKEEHLPEHFLRFD